MKKFYDEPIRKEYRKLQVDDMPVIESFERLDYTQLLKEYPAEHGKPLKPVSRRKGCLPVFNDIIYPKCGAPHSYIYRNNGKAKNTQYLCKVCDFTFGNSTNYLKAAAMPLKPFVDNYDYPLTSSICGDETYIKVNGKWHLF